MPPRSTRLQRDDLLRDRYQALTHTQRLTHAQALDQLATEFFLSHRTLHRILKHHGQEPTQTRSGNPQPRP